MMNHIGKLIFPKFITISTLVFLTEFRNPQLIKFETGEFQENYQASFNKIDLT